MASEREVRWRGVFTDLYKIIASLLPSPNTVLVIDVIIREAAENCTETCMFLTARCLLTWDCKGVET